MPPLSRMRCCQCCRQARKAVILLLCLALLVCCLGLALNWPDQLLRLRPPRRSVEIASVVQPARPVSSRLNESAIKLLFSRMVGVTQMHSGPYKDRVAQMMSRQLPLVATDAWRLHSPAGRRYSLTEVQRLALGSVGEGNSVPNIAHYVLPFGDTHIQFHHMVCLLSCLHVMRPSRLLLWYVPGRLPQGEWWQRLLSNLTQAEWESRVILVQRPVPTRIYTVPVVNKEHRSDIMRLEALLVFGGIYLDMDVIVLKPLEPLRRHACVIGREISYGLCNGAILASPNATFLAMWHTAYQVFNDASWGEHSVRLPNSMNSAFPGLCHVEEDSMNRPNWTPEEIRWIYTPGRQSAWNWREKNYMMHLWFRNYGVQYNLQDVRHLDSMFGEMCRFILYGSDPSNGCLSVSPFDTLLSLSLFGQIALLNFRVHQ